MLEYLNRPYLFPSNACYYFLRILLIQRYDIIDIEYYNDGTAIKGIYSDNGASITSNGEYITITTSTSGEKHVKYPISFVNNDNIEIEYIYMGGTTQPLTLIIGNKDTTGYQGYCSYDGGSTWVWAFGTSSTKYKSISVGAKIRLRRINGLTELYVNDELYLSSAETINGNCTFGHYTNNGRVQKLKEIKIRRL